MGRINRQIDPLGQVQSSSTTRPETVWLPGLRSRQKTRTKPTGAGLGNATGPPYRFNRAGNPVSRTSWQETPNYLGCQPEAVASIKDGQETTYGYDLLGWRISKTTAGVKTKFYWDGDALLGELRFERKDGTDVDAEPVWTGWREWILLPRQSRALGDGGDRLAGRGYPARGAKILCQRPQRLP